MNLPDRISLFFRTNIINLFLILMFIVITSTVYLAITVRFNLTPSMDKGLYFMLPSDKKPAPGDMVTFCLGEDNYFSQLAIKRSYLAKGICPSGLQPLLKRLAGLAGDEITVTTDGILVNGLYLYNSARPDHDSLGRLIPPSLLKTGIIPEGQALVISQNNTNSFDSRHFGLVPQDSLSLAKPFLVINK